MNTKSIICIILLFLVLVLLAGNICLGILLIKNMNENKALQYNSKVLNFRNMFTQNVLLSDKEVDFDTRLALENAVRSLNDQEIFNQWEAFTNSQTKDEASVEAKKLLQILIEKTPLTKN